jgi:hypothetical protein
MKATNVKKKTWVDTVLDKDQIFSVNQNIRPLSKAAYGLAVEN